MPKGTFDKDTVSPAWFDAVAITLGWFDEMLIDDVVAAAVDTRLKPWQLQAQMGGLIAQ